MLAAPEREKDHSGKPCSFWAVAPTVETGTVSLPQHLLSLPSGGSAEPGCLVLSG